MVAITQIHTSLGNIRTVKNYMAPMEQPNSLQEMNMKIFLAAVSKSEVRSLEPTEVSH